MHSFLSLQTSFHFPAYDAWKLESIIFQWLIFSLQAVSGLILLQGRKLRFSTLQHIEIIEFPVSVVSTPTGDQQPETGPAHLGPVPHITTAGTIHE
jgi:hypothetical protein|tara:strand:- start:535 stop:822 length:288 start_codon:yes stop_codon:yes gene_type:complete